MSDITKTDRNFVVIKHPNFGNTAYYDADSEPFEIFGVFREGEQYMRLPESISKRVNESVAFHGMHTAGGRIRFKTDSSFVAIRTKMHDICKMPHFPLTGSAGFDLYEKNDGQWKYDGTFVPPFDIDDGYESIIYFNGRGERELIINMPLYAGVNKIEIGIEAGSGVYPPEKYANDKPVVYYGSSITQGGCASRPGTCYPSVLSRRFNLDYINLGFSGGARGETVIREYIAGLDMGMFVLDYDHNAENVEMLQSTHYNVYKAVRKAHKDIPIIMMSRPKYYLDNDEKNRLDVIKQTYNRAVSENDENVYLIDGKMLMKAALDEGTVDNCHPNDFGFMSMADAVGVFLEKIL